MDNLVKLVSRPIDNIYIYTRVSTGKQSTDKKFGLISQRYLCEKYINKFYTNDSSTLYFSDTGSSYKTQKILTGMKEMICKLKSNSLILISETSRLGRSYKMIESILKIVKKKKSFIVAVSENLVYGKSKLHDKIFIQKVIESEKESDMLSLRIKNAQAYIKKNGGYIGKAPFGYTIKKDHRNIPVLKEQKQDFELIDEIVNLSYECCSYEEIKNKMNIKNLLHKNKLWTTKKIKDILNKFYPEHILLNINDKHENITVIENEEIPKKTLHKRIKNTVYEKLKITISNDKRQVQYYDESTTPITLRSGKEINRFLFY